MREAQGVPEGTSKLHESHDEVAQMPVVCIPALLPSLSQPEPTVSWKVLFDRSKIDGAHSVWIQHEDHWVEIHGEFCYLPV